MNTARVDLNLLTIFDAVAQTRSVSAAAKQLSLSQPAVSHALNRLRRLTGDPLFIRAKGGLMPSPRALAMRDEANGIIRAAQTLLGPATFDPTSETRLFRIACSDYSNMTMLPAMLKAFRKKAPHCTFEMVQAGTSTLKQLVTGDINCSFWGVNAPEKPYSSVVLFKERLVGIICRSHPLAAVVQNGDITLEGYLSYPHAVVALGVSTNNPVERALQAKGLNRNIRFVGQSLIGNLDALIDTDLIMSLPARLIDHANTAGFVSFELPFLVEDYPYYLIWHLRTESDPASVWLRHEITAIATNKAS